MATWTGGYVTDIPYTAGFYREMSPVYLNFLTVMLGKQTPDLSQEFTYCELGCGLGYGTNILAASNPNGRFWGFDFNPAQIAGARALAVEAGLPNVTFGEDSFEYLATQSHADLPQFDYITLHGTYTWISEENRGHIVKFIQRKLKPGGMVYLSYNAMPGWAQMAPLQRLIREHAKLNPGRSDLQMEQGLEFAKSLRATGAGYFVANTTVPDRMDKLAAQNRNYLAHEYLNESWFLLYFADVVRELEPAKLNYVGSASIPENIPAMCIPTLVMPIYEAATDVVLQQTIKDFAINQQFRRDIFVRGASPLIPGDSLDILGNTRFVLAMARDKVKPVFPTPLGEAAGDLALYGVIYDALATGPKTFDEIRTLPQLSALSFGTALQAVSLITHAGQAHPLRHNSDAGLDSARRLNTALGRRIYNGSEFPYVAAGRLGTGQTLAGADGYGLEALRRRPEATPLQLAEDVVAILKRVGRSMLHEGKAVPANAAVANLEPQMEVFLKKHLPIYEQAGIV